MKKIALSLSLLFLACPLALADGFDGLDVTVIKISGDRSARVAGMAVSWPIDAVAIDMSHRAGGDAVRR